MFLDSDVDSVLSVLRLYPSRGRALHPCFLRRVPTIPTYSLSESGRLARRFVCLRLERACYQLIDVREPRDGSTSDG